MTTACVEAKGLPDDCYELTALRNYRDTWLKTTEEGQEIIRQYYEIAPQIVSAINKRDDSTKIYDMLYVKMVKPCAEMIEHGKMEDVLALYRFMTLKLKEKYC